MSSSNKLFPGPSTAMNKISISKFSLDFLEEMMSLLGGGGCVFKSLLVLEKDPMISDF